MQQLELSARLPMPANLPAGRPEFSQDCCDLTATCGDGAACTISLGRQTVRVKRPLGGSFCRINVKTDDFDGVAVVAGNGGLIVRLLHRDPWLTVDLVTDARLAAALNLRDDIARQFRLPALLIDADGRTCGNLKKYGAILAAAPAPRRSSPVNRLRPRFLKRRAIGRPAVRPRLAGREIIART